VLRIWGGDECPGCEIGVGDARGEGYVYPPGMGSGASPYPSETIFRNSCVKGFARMGTSIGPAGHVGFDRGLIGPGLESEEPAGLLVVFEQRSVLAAAPSARRRRTRPRRARFSGPADSAHSPSSRQATERRFLVAGVAGIN
jgi:hypothetical protein